jgi:hypothetical protein
MKITKRQLRRIIKEETVKLSRGRLLREAYTRDEVVGELEDINDLAEQLLLALDRGGIETPDMGGLTFEESETMRRPLENIRHELSELIEELIGRA